MTGILWFRNDLRLHDNLALQAAVEHCDQIVPVYILDERWMSTDQYGFRRTGPFRMKFLLESLHDLKDHLKEKGSDLIIRQGNTADILIELAQQYGATTIYASKEYTHEEILTEEIVEAEMHLELFHNSTLYHPEDVPFSIDQLPRVFTAFRKKAEKYSEVRPPIESPESISSPDLDVPAVPMFSDFFDEPLNVDSRGVLPFKGGATQAWKRLNHYFWDTQGLSTYKETRNGLIGADYSSKFSVWLANGCISARAIFDEVEAYESEVEENKSTYWMKFELLWRDFFKYVAMKHGRRIFYSGGIQGKHKKWKNNTRDFQSWAYGETGDPFVDANMKELLLTGFMSNRGRQNVASYLVHKLGEDWRKGAAWFESYLIDYDVTSNWGNWMYAAGVGNDPRDRIFNTKKQAKDYDPKGEYRDLWLKRGQNSTS